LWLATQASSAVSATFFARVARGFEAVVFVAVVVFRVRVALAFGAVASLDVASAAGASTAFFARVARGLAATASSDVVAVSVAVLAG
jgi:hypothetical protein